MSERQPSNPGSKPDQRLRPRERLRRQRDFARVFAGKHSAADQALVAYAEPNGLGWSRLGIVVGRRLGNSVRRHYIRRRIREAFRTQKADLPVGYDFVCIGRMAAGDQNWDVARSLRRLTLEAVRSNQSAGLSRNDT